MATKTARMFETRIDLDEATREKLVALLNARLADTFDLYSQLKQAHWSVRGSDFIQLHELYDTVAESVLEFVDEIAERAAALGGLATGTVRMAAEASSLDEYPLDAVAGEDTVHVVADARGEVTQVALAQEEALPVTLMPTVYVHASIAAYAGVDVGSGVLVALADAVGSGAAGALGAIGAIGGQPACLAPGCASAPY